jgi:hypothetical protein
MDGRLKGCTLYLMKGVFHYAATVAYVVPYFVCYFPPDTLEVTGLVPLAELLQGIVL